MKELSLRPYPGRLFVARSKKDYEIGHKRLFKTPDILTCGIGGRFCGGEGMDGMWTYLVYAETTSVMAHELSHVIFAVFERCGINPADSGGEVFCYTLQQLMNESGFE